MINQLSEDEFTDYIIKYFSYFLILLYFYIHYSDPLDHYTLQRNGNASLRPVFFQLLKKILGANLFMNLFYILQIEMIKKN